MQELYNDSSACSGEKDDGNRVDRAGSGRDGDITSQGK